MTEKIEETVITLVGVLSSEVNCSHCQAEFPIGRAMRRSAQDDKVRFASLCPVCGIRLTMDNATAEIVNELSQVTSRQVSCSHCQAEFPLGSAMRESAQDDEVYLIFVCPKCGTDISNICVGMGTGTDPHPVDVKGLAESFGAFVSASTWDESKCIVEQHPELLSAEADSAIQAVISGAEDPETKRSFQEHLVVLSRCREEGFEQAFIEKGASVPFCWYAFVTKDRKGEILAPSMRETILAFINADTWSESKRMVEQHPDLALPAVDFWIRRLAMGQEDERARRLVQEHLALLARCRAVGVERAFADKINPPERTRQEILLSYINADSLEESQRIVEQYPELLLMETEGIAQRIETTQEDERARRVVHEYRALLARCREVGVERAFAEKRSASTFNR